MAVFFRAFPKPWRYELSSKPTCKCQRLTLPTYVRSSDSCRLSFLTGISRAVFTLRSSCFATFSEAKRLTCSRPVTSAAPSTSSQTCDHRSCFFFLNMPSECACVSPRWYSLAHGYAIIKRCPLMHFFFFLCERLCMIPLPPLGISCLILQLIATRRILSSPMSETCPLLKVKFPDFLISGGSLIMTDTGVCVYQLFN